MEKKIINVKALDVDPSTKRVKIAISQMQSEDTDKDIFDQKAWDKTIKENGPKGSNEIWHLLDHTSKTFSALSKFSELGVEGKYLAGVSIYKNSFAWREVAWPLYEAGDITQHSVGFQTLDATDRNNKGVRIIKQARLFEGSAVLWGAQPDTPTMAMVKSLMNIDEDRDITAAEKIEEIMKKLKSHRIGYNDEDYSLFIIELKRLQTLFDAGQISKIFKEPDTKATPQVECPNCHQMTYNMPDGSGMITCQHCGQMFDENGNMKNSTGETTEPNKPTLPGTVECPACFRHTHNTQESKGYIRCHRCDAVFIYGSKLFYKH